MVRLTADQVREFEFLLAQVCLVGNGVVAVRVKNGQPRFVQAVLEKNFDGSADSEISKAIDSIYNSQV